jgi:protein TonB
MPLAAGVTLLLLISMANLIAAEFKPQDKLATSSFEINPVPDDLPPVINITPPDPLKQVEVPPPPPTLDVEKVAEVELPIIVIDGGITPFDPSTIEIPFGERGIVSVDGDPSPIVRIPPVFPARFSQGNYSGYCRVSFDISAEGQPFNVTTLDCTNRQLKAASIKSVQKWKYTPKILDGRPVSRAGLETTIQFRLKDERGRLLPLPNSI